MSDENDNPGIRRTQYVVFGLIGLVLIALAFIWGGPLVGFGLVALLVYEGYTLIDKWQANTISEIIWISASRPLIPLMFGAAWGAWLMYLTMTLPIHPKSVWLASVAGLLMGHFFFQAKREEKKIMAETIASNIGKVSLNAESGHSEGMMSLTDDHTGKIDLVKKAMETPKVIPFEKDR